MTGHSLWASSLQSLPDPAREGLPFWIFWLLLSIILLLLFFIFLRDKDLRLRLSAFLSGAKRRMLLLRLQAKLRKEKEKKSGLWKELGQTAWSEDVRIEGTGEVFRKLKVLEEEKSERQAEWLKIYSQIEALGKQYEEARKSQQEAVRTDEALKKPFEERLAELESRERELKKKRGEAETPELDTIAEEEARLGEEKAAVRAKLEARDRTIREMKLKHKEENGVREQGIREWEKKKESVQLRIIELKKTSEPLYESMGRILDGTRVEHKELDLWYFQIDGVNKAIQDLQAKIEKLQ